MTDSPNATELADFAATTVSSAGRVAMGHFRTALAIDAKPDDSPVTIADRETECVLRDAITARFPDHAILGEEFGMKGGTDGALWIVDPIDGTRSFIAGHPLFGVLLGFVENGTPRLGTVHMPALGETFVGVAGSGATLNGRAVATRNITELDDALLFINEAERLIATAPAVFESLCRVGRQRRMAYDCYPHALVAIGSADAVVDCGLEPYDYLPLVALVEAAGGIITDWAGEPLGLHSDGRVVTAATPALHARLLRLLGA